MFFEALCCKLCIRIKTLDEEISSALRDLSEEEYEMEIRESELEGAVGGAVGGVESSTAGSVHQRRKSVDTIVEVHQEDSSVFGASTRIHKKKKGNGNNNNNNNNNSTTSDIPDGVEDKKLNTTIVTPGGTRKTWL